MFCFGFVANVARRIGFIANVANREACSPSPALEENDQQMRTVGSFPAGRWNAHDPVAHTGYIASEWQGDHQFNPVPLIPRATGDDKLMEHAYQVKILHMEILRYRITCIGTTPVALTKTHSRSRLASIADFSRFFVFSGGSFRCGISTYRSTVNNDGVPCSRLLIIETNWKSRAASSDSRRGKSGIVPSSRNSTSSVSFLLFFWSFFFVLFLRRNTKFDV